jgi:hypothetical protein
LPVQVQNAKKCLENFEGSRSFGKIPKFFNECTARDTKLQEQERKEQLLADKSLMLDSGQC